MSYGIDDDHVEMHTSFVCAQCSLINGPNATRCRRCGGTEIVKDAGDGPDGYVQHEEEELEDATA